MFWMTTCSLAGEDSALVVVRTETLLAGTAGKGLCSMKTESFRLRLNRCRYFMEKTEHMVTVITKQGRGRYVNLYDDDVAGCRKFFSE